MLAFTVFGDVLLVLDQFVAHLLLPEVGTTGAQAIDPVDDVADQVKPIQFIEHRHIKRRGGGAFFLVAAHVQA